MSMDFFEAVKRRRSIRKFTEKAVPAEVIERAFEAASLAPNSSNTQTWDFYWVRSPEKKSKLVKYCLNQAPARSAQELVVIVADHKNWKRSHKPLLEWIKADNAPRAVHAYYKKLIPATYRSGILNVMSVVKLLYSFITGLYKPMMRGPITGWGLEEVAVKSAALATENFVLAITAQGYATCLMEGFDEWRVKWLLGLRSSARVVVVIAIGEESPRGIWGTQMRLPMDQVVHKV